MGHHSILFRDLTDLIAKDQLEEAIKRLLTLLLDKDRTLYNAAILTAGKHESLKRDQALGIINSEDLLHRKANIVNSLLYIIEELSKIIDHSNLAPLADKNEVDLLLKRKNNAIKRLEFLHERLSKTSSYNEEYQLKIDIEFWEKELDSIKNEIKEIINN